MKISLTGGHVLSKPVRDFHVGNALHNKVGGINHLQNVAFGQQQRQSLSGFLCTIAAHSSTQFLSVVVEVFLLMWYGLPGWSSTAISA